MKRMAGAFLALMMIALLLTSCWNRRELDTLGIALGIGIDKQDGEYIVSAQLANVSAVAAKKGGSAAAPVLVVQEKGRILLEAFRHMTVQIPRKVYLSHMRILVISEEVAREGMKYLLDLSRDHEIRGDFYVVIARNTSAQHVLEVITPFERMSANKLYMALEQSEKNWAPTRGVLLNDFLQQSFLVGKEPVLPGVTIENPGQSANKVENTQRTSDLTITKFSTLGVFRQDKLIGWLNEEESKGYNYITGNVSSTIGITPCPGGGIIGLEVKRADSSVTGQFRNGKPEIRINITVDVNVAEAACNIDLVKPEVIARVERDTEKNFSDLLRASVYKAQRVFRSDIFGFGKALHKADFTEWKKIKSKWNAIYPDVPVHITTHVNLNETGTQLNSYLKFYEKAD
ncbi:Ger(x)C family spore germination protein [Paenibacillus profundus]|uniref:Ger(X)C family spore germination protein n=1 Tax=Paenibacillus profundus TaxID=1173085 RepID=A0ABS8YAR2_9BACL|nr:Ger(x)C family spore germination protein [Paenibacillus profundus]MCE5169040.1 Ger(x)C family spore germination protein [Paenibacillus profundus]